MRHKQGAHGWSCGAVATLGVVWAVASTLPGPASGADLTDSFPAMPVTLRDMAGTIRLEPSEDGRLHLNLSWDTPLTVSARTVEGRLIVAAEGWPTSGGTVVVGQSTRVEVGEGARSSVTIGSSVSNGGAVGAAMPHLSGAIRLPAGTALRLDGPLRRLEGTVRLGAVAGAVAGAEQISLTAQGPIDLQVTGAGGVDLSGAQSDVTLALTGGGRAQLGACAIGRLTLKVTGAAEVRVNCPAEQAAVTAIGGTVHLQEVTGRLERSVVGGRVTVGQ